MVMCIMLSTNVQSELNMSIPTLTSEALNASFSKGSVTASLQCD